MTVFLSRIWQLAWSWTMLEMNSREIAWLLSPRDHLSLLTSRRTAMIVSRVRLVAGAFAVLTPLWIFIDLWAFPWAVSKGLIVVRLAATAAFSGLVVSLRSDTTMGDAYRALALLLGVPTAFFLFSYLHMANFQLHGLEQAFATGYAYLPFVMLAGLSIFPLTAVECLGFVAPMLFFQLLAAMLRLPVLDWPTFAASFWLLLLIAAVSLMAGISQLALMIVLVRESIRDPLTGCFSRRSGEELGELQFSLARRTGSPVSMAFVDLDRFKQVNDEFGHDAGDSVLVNAAAAMRNNVRDSDMVVRWGGEEFLLIMPNTPHALACQVLDRLRTLGFGRKPDGSPVTASIGVSSTNEAAAIDWHHLVEVADKRMYAAKQGGRNRVVGCAEADNGPQAAPR